ncbi:MAG: AraC family transcriptional regulator [Oscillospiraceae bacterium]|nr:AraC family transcriptional regulator [Oscillospiraceae bacterium]
MYMNFGYLTDSKVPLKDKSAPLIVASCGTYRLCAGERLPTRRPRGRLDYQLLYVASGKTHFMIRGKDCEVTAGHMVLYLPQQEQDYVYYGEDKPEVYWVHFTGSDVKNILRSYHLPMEENIFGCGVSPTYVHLFQEMIRELQTKKVGFQELLTMYLRQIFLLVQRSRLEERSTVSTYMQEEMEEARRYFDEHYNEDIRVEEFAMSRSMSVSWFLRNFKRVTGMSPMHYILTKRINNAVNLLETTDYNIAEISAIVGYENSMYFSRLFKKQNGVSPTEYRKLLQEHWNEVR